MAERKKIAAIVTEYRPRSHADVIVGRLLGGYWLHGRHHEPRLDVARMYTDQIAKEDQSRDLAREYGYEIVPTIRHALTGVPDDADAPRTLAVNGVLLIGEHGDYPYNGIGQKMYPRHELFSQIVDVFRETGQTAPLFNDKHLSYDWDKARWMFDQVRELGFPFMAGSVIPLARHPDLRWDWQRPMSHAVQLWQASFDRNKDSYGFHALERLQSMVERRAGHETGVAAVTCHEGAPVWDWTEERPWAAKLLQALTGKDVASLRQSVSEPMVFAMEHRDGLESTVYRVNEIDMDAEFAALETADGEALVTPNEAASPRPVHLPDEERERYPVANHFAAEVNLFEEMVLTGHVEHPPERTLLTTGVLAAVHESSYEPAAAGEERVYREAGRRLETPHLAIEYQAREETGSWRG